MEKKPNTQECDNFGRKMSLKICNIQVLSGEICIGSDNDDQIFFGGNLKESEEMLTKRVKIYIMDSSYDYYNEIDLEEVLRFAKEHCSKMCDRIFEK